MTRQEFISDVDTWSDLIDFCNNEGCENYVSDVFNEEVYDEDIHELLERKIKEDSWQEILSWLEDLPDGYDYYIINEYENWRGCDDNDFESIKRDVLEYMDRNAYWEEDEEEPVETCQDPEDNIPIAEEDVSFSDLFATCNSKVRKIQNDEIAAEAEEEQAEEQLFEDFCISAGMAVTK